MKNRLRQVLYFLFVRPTAEDLRRASSRLSPELFALFQSMKSQDQAHGARVADRMVALNAPAHLVAAAYLHDAGKPHDFGLLWRCAMVLFPGTPPLEQPLLRTPLARARQVYHHHCRYAAAAVTARGGHPEAIAIILNTPGTPWLAEFQEADNTN